MRRFEVVAGEKYGGEERWGRGYLNVTFFGEMSAAFALH